MKNLKEISTRLEIAKKNIKKKQNKNRRTNAASIGKAFKISTELVAALFVGVGIGLIVDNFLGTKPFGLIIFFILGAFAGFLNVYRVMRRIEKQ